MISRRRAERYRPLRNYALIGDMRAAALVGKDGSIDFWCAPRFDAPAVFCRLLDAERGGFFRVAPTGDHEVERRYEPDTNVLVTSFRTSSGCLRITDFMPVGEDRSGEPTRILRCVEGLSGSVDVEIQFRPTFGFARAEASVEPCLGGALARSADGRELLTLACPGRLEPDGPGALSGRWGVSAGARVWVGLAHARHGPSEEIGGLPAEIPDAAVLGEPALERTIAFWRRWAEACTFEGPYAPLVRRSALVLKLLTYAPTGAVVAAPTTSLPEAVGGVRNWDYRYTWLRDAAWVVDALMRLGQHEGAMAFWRWLERVARRDGGRLRILYDVDGESPPAERVLAHLEGYRGSAPVRTGNGAVEQVQLDVWGDVLDALHLCVSRMPAMRPLRPEVWELVTTLADEAASRWREPDQGLWEMRRDARHYTSSKLLCWVALDRAIRLARHRGGGADAPSRWRRERDAVREAILRGGYDASLGSFTQALGSHVLDASALLIPLVGFLPPSDPRVRSTMDRLAEALADPPGQGGLLRRYRSGPGGGEDGLPGAEGAFSLCTLWLVENLALVGRTDEARALFERVSGSASDLGLLAEQIDPASGELLGNYPQGFTHLGLIRAAIRISESEARRGRP